MSNKVNIVIKETGEDAWLDPETGKVTQFKEIEVAFNSLTGKVAKPEEEILQKVKRMPDALKKLTKEKKLEFEQELRDLCNQNGIPADFSMLFRKYGLPLGNSKHIVDNILDYYSLNYRPVSPKRIVLTDAQLTNIYDLFEDGHSVDEIAHMIRTSESYIRALVNDQGLKAGIYQAGSTIIRRYEIRGFLKDKWTIDDICSYYGITYEVLEKALDKFRSNNPKYSQTT